VLWLLEELGVPYEIKRYQRNPKTMLAPPELKAVHPLGKSPVITDEAQTIAESGAIMEYLVERYGKHLRPAEGTPERLRYTYWLHYAEGSAMPLLLMRLVFSRIPKGPMPFFVKPIARRIVAKVEELFITPNLELHLDFMEGELAKSAYFAGDELTAADIQMSFVVEGAAARGGLTSSRPRLWSWLQKVQARPAYKRAIEKGGPYGLLV